MQNHMIVMRAALPQNRLLNVDPLAMAQRDYENRAQYDDQTSDDTNHASDTEREAFTLASPFCNPDF